GMGADYDILDISRLRKHLIKDMTPKKPEGLPPIDSQNLIEDFVCITMLLGNDFLPKMPGIGTGVNVLMKAYREVYHIMGGPITSRLTQGRIISVDRFLKFLDYLGATHQVLGESLTDISDRLSPKVDQQSTAQRANDWVKTLCWAFQYYSGTDVPSWRHYYPHHYPPSISDVLRNVTSGSIDQIFPKDVPMRPFEQLMCVIPQSCNELLPPPFRDLFTDPNSPIKEFFPETQNAHRKIRRLPFIDEAKLVAAMAPRYPHVKPQDAIRDKISGRVHLFAGL